MARPLTPREKVDLKPCPFCGGAAWLNDYEAKYSDLPPKSRSPQCRSCGASLGYLTTPAKATEAWNRRTALASGSGDHSGGVTDMIGSGDHAELADLLDLQAVLRADRLPECSFDDGKTWELDGVGVAETFSRAAGALEALLAENAALRGERDQMRSLHNRATDRSRHWEIASINADNRATEAERKLAEADGLMIELADAPQPKDTGGRFFRAMSSINAYVARLNASKEAERG